VNPAAPSRSPDRLRCLEILWCAPQTSDTELRLGVYKKKGNHVERRITANAGIQADHKRKDLLATVLEWRLEGEAESSGFLRASRGVQYCFAGESQSQCFPSRLNLACSASQTHEAAFCIRSISPAAIGANRHSDRAALRGDGTRLISSPMPGPSERRETTHEFQHKTIINLLGDTRAVSVVRMSRTTQKQTRRFVITSR